MWKTSAKHFTKFKRTKPFKHPTNKKIPKGLWCNPTLKHTSLHYSFASTVNRNGGNYSAFACDWLNLPPKTAILESSLPYHSTPTPNPLPPPAQIQSSPPLLLHLPHSTETHVNLMYIPALPSVPTALSHLSFISNKAQRSSCTCYALLFSRGFLRDFAIHFCLLSASPGMGI